ncbi:MAG: hypothetical protein RR540_01230 [Oscillospiraceae bacterium]
METEKTLALFQIISGQKSAEYLPLVELSMNEVLKMLKEKADETDARLCYLSAAVANFRYVEIDCAREKQMLAVGGSIGVNGGGANRYLAAKNLVDSYRVICRDLIRDEEFIFFGTRG